MYINITYYKRFESKMIANELEYTRMVRCIKGGQSILLCFDKHCKEEWDVLFDLDNKEFKGEYEEIATAEYIKYIFTIKSE
jgi:hypothetical protein